MSLRQAKVSVVIPAYNSAPCIRDAVESALGQGYGDMEVIVVDDGSTDGTKEALADLAGAGKVVYIYQENRGAGAARNAGVRVSGGEYIAFLDSDDLWLEGKIEKQVAFMESRGLDAVFCAGYYSRPDGSSRLVRPAVRGDGGFFDMLSAEARFVPTAGLFRKEALEGAGLFNEGLPCAEDWDLWVRMARTARFGYLDLPLYKKRYNEVSLTSKTIDKVVSVLKGVLVIAGEAGFGRKDTGIIKKRFAKECFISARKCMSALKLADGLRAYYWSCQMAPSYMPKIFGLLARYARFSLKNRHLPGSAVSSRRRL